MTVKFSIVSFVVIIRIFIVIGFASVSGIIIITRMFQCRYYCYCDCHCLLIVLTKVRFRFWLGCPGSVISVYGPTFHGNPIYLCINFQCQIYLNLVC